MKKSLFIIILVCLSSNTFAQFDGGERSPFSFMFNTSGAIAWFKANSTAPSSASTSLKGVGCIGASIDYQFNDYFSMRGGLFLSGKGSNVDGLLIPYTADIITSYDLYYLEETLYFTGHIPLGNDANIFLGTGPYYANGLFGSSKVNYESGPNQGVKFGNTGDFKSNDYGITSLIGFKAERGYSISLVYDLGLTNIAQPRYTNVYNLEFKNRSVYISFGYSF